MSLVLLALSTAAALPAFPEPPQDAPAASPWDPVLTRLDQEAIDDCIFARLADPQIGWEDQCALANGALDRLTAWERLPSGLGVPITPLTRANDLLMARAQERLAAGDVEGAAEDLAAPLRWSADLGHASVTALELMVLLALAHDVLERVEAAPHPGLVAPLERWLMVEPPSAEQRAWTMFRACEQDRRVTVEVLAALPGVEGLSREMAHDCAVGRAELLGAPAPPAPAPGWFDRFNPYGPYLQDWRGLGAMWSEEGDALLVEDAEARAAAWEALLDAEHAALEDQITQAKSARPRP